MTVWVQGYIDLDSGEVALEFVSSFRVALLGVPCGIPLKVATTLTTSTSSGKLFKAAGELLGADGTCM